jgi:hypothetical protein
MIIDPFVSCHGVSAAIDLVVKKDCGAIADRTSAAVELVHHVCKMSAGSSGEFTADVARGASALIGGGPFGACAQRHIVERRPTVSRLPKISGEHISA